MTADDLSDAQRLVRRAPIGERVVEGSSISCGPPGRARATRSCRRGSAGDRVPGRRRRSCWPPAPARLVDGRLSPSLDGHRGARRADPQTSHGADFRRSRRRGDGFRRDRPARGKDFAMRHEPNNVQPDAPKRKMTLSPSIRQEAAALSSRLPSLVIAARNVAQTVRHGVHGRRRAGSGETFWQFQAVHLRRTLLEGRLAPLGREEHAFVRERECGRRRILSGSGSTDRRRCALDRASPRRRKSTAPR